MGLRPSSAARSTWRLRTCRGEGATGLPSCQTHVAEDERGRLEPRNPAQRGEVRPQDEVAVALLPAGDAVARDGIHLHVVGEQVVAALDAVLVDVVFDEELPVQALAHEPALHVGEGDDHRVDRAVLDRRRQFVQRQHGSGVYAVPTA